MPTSWPNNSSPPRTVASFEQAKGVLPERAGIGVDEAFTLMRSHALRNNQQLIAVADAVIEGTVSESTLEAPPGRRDHSNGGCSTTE